MDNRFDRITNKDFINVFNEATNKSDIIRYFNMPNNGSSMRFINSKIKELNLDMNIIKENYFNKYHIKKVCPVCGKEFFTETSKKASKQVCCSNACSNTYFRSGENNGMFKKYVELNGGDIEKLKNARYRQELEKKKRKEYREKHGVTSKIHQKICFRHHPHKCCICGEENIVAVHHYDENHYNNNPNNLIPLCPTHHAYWHSKFKELIKDKVDEYVKKFRQGYNNESM